MNRTAQDLADEGRDVNGDLAATYMETCAGAKTVAPLKYLWRTWRILST